MIAVVIAVSGVITSQMAPADTIWAALRGVFPRTRFTNEFSRGVRRDREGSFVRFSVCDSPVETALDMPSGDMRAAVSISCLTPVLEWTRREDGWCGGGCCHHF